MFYALLYPLRDHWIVMNIFKYITFRCAGAAVTAFLLTLWLGPRVIDWLKNLKIMATTKRAHAEQIHKYYEAKASVPTMGGILLLVAVTVSMILWGNLSNKYVLLSLAVFLWFGGVGFIDDYLKIRSGTSKGLASLSKILGQLILGIVLGFYLFSDPSFDHQIYIPFLKNVSIHLGLFLIPFVICVLIGTSNALNVTDGLDGLAVGCLLFAAGTFAVMSYVTGHAAFAKYLAIPFIPHAGELAVFCSALVGAGTGFLWFNSFPASVFMGDTGSLSLGGVLGAIAIFIKKELLLVIVGGVFVWEAFSVILQVASFKLFKRRIFKMSPFHHHLQLMGVPESKVTIRLWIVAFMLSILGLSTLKIQ
ncbi:MAG: phospho-N-acetylmuramoyl-pentapeptide-transferase [Candidatus Omnitrophica bacterium]|nr:phospho-N-acetylmuramoyl-pentapeptide-transferase [Candidatus Omnitrophota bacterium]